LTRLGRYSLDGGGLQAARNAAAVIGRINAIWLRLPPRLLLEKTISLPLAAEREIERVLQYGMDRETPFSADEVWWSYDTVQRDRAKGKLHVRLSLIPRDAIADLLEALTHGGLSPSVLDVSIGDGTTRQIPFNGGMHGTRVALTREAKIGAAACVFLAVVAVGLPFLKQSVALSTLDSRAAALQPAVNQAEEIRRQLGGSAGAEIIQDQRTKVGDPLAVLSSATTLLPDDTYLTDFTMRQRKLDVMGQSVGAAKLIGALAASPTFKNPAFSAPITRIEGSRTEGFSISAEAAP
jgi:general secretion pathway protein L